MNISEFATLMVKNIVKNPDMVKVSSFDGDDNSVIVEILVHSDDMGAVIGRNGKNAKAIRTMINAYAYVNDIRNIKINIDSF